MKCNFILPNGKKCKGNATMNNMYCSIHKKNLFIVSIHSKLTFISYMIFICVFLNFYILFIFHDKNDINTTFYVKNDIVPYVKQQLYLSSEKILRIYKKCTNI